MTPATAVPLLELADVNVRFGGLSALSGVTLRIAEHELVGLIGPNGAGKSTLIGVIAGSLRPTGGTVTFTEQAVHHLTVSKRAHLGIGRSFQHPSMFESLTVEDNLTIGLTSWSAGYGRRARRQRRAEAERILGTLGLERWRDVAAADLPYGIKKLVDVGRVLARNPKLVLLDEPCAGLNIHEKQELADVILRTWEQRRFAAVIVEHDVDFVTSLSQRLYALDAGRVIAEGSPEVVQTDPAVIEAFLGVA